MFSSFTPRVTRLHDTSYILVKSLLFLLHLACFSNMHQPVTLSS